MARGPSPRFDPASYPGPRPAGPVVVRGGGHQPVGVGGPGERPLTGPAADEVPGPLHYSVAYGSNACVDRLVDKRLDEPGAVLLPARTRGWASAYVARRTHYGSVPLALVPGAPDAVTDTWVLGLPPATLATLDRTEARRPGPPPDRREAGRAPLAGYLLGRIGPVAVADRYLLRDALAYRPVPGTPLLCDETAAGWLTWPEHGQADAARALERGAPTLAAPPAERVVEGAWPATPLEDLPLFVYGTLRPDGPAWPHVAGLVEVAGSARAAGRLYDTPHGWPAAVLGAVGEVQGVLLEPRGPAVAAELVARVDDHEGAPQLFRRCAVPVHTPGGRPRWAIAYHWPDDTPPGALLRDGRWPPGR